MTEQAKAIVREIVNELESLPDGKIIEVLDFARFLRRQPEYRGKYHKSRVLNETRLAQLYGESAEEDKQISELGMSDYATALKSEDSNAKG
jgi:hypothetical protein